MKLVIDIEQEWYERACKATMSLDGALQIYQSIKEGTPYKESPQKFKFTARFDDDEAIVYLTGKGGGS